MATVRTYMTIFEPFFYALGMERMLAGELVNPCVFLQSDQADRTCFFFAFIIHEFLPLISCLRECPRVYKPDLKPIHIIEHGRQSAYYGYGVQLRDDRSNSGLLLALTLLLLMELAAHYRMLVYLLLLLDSSWFMENF